MPKIKATWQVMMASDLKIGNVTDELRLRGA